MLMTFRGFQGLAMGGLVALSQSILATVVSPRDRGRYSGYMAAVMALSTAGGPVIGGVITDLLGWRWCFLLVVPIALASAVVLQLTLTLPKSPTRQSASFDYLGAALFTVAATLPMLWVTFAGVDYPWLSWQSLAFGLGFVIVAGLAVVVEFSVPEPVVPLRLLAHRTTMLMIIAGMGSGVAMFALATFMTQYFQLARGYDPTTAGLLTIPMIVAQTLSTTIAGQIVTRSGRWKPLMLVGGVLMVLGLATLATIDSDTPYLVVAVGMSVTGIGVGTMMQNTVLAVQNVVPLRDVGAASAAVAFFRSVGGAVGVSVLGAVLAAQVDHHLMRRLLASGTDPAVLDQLDGSLDFGALPAPVRLLVEHAYGDSFGLLFAIACGVAVVTFLAVFGARETRLRDTIDLPPRPDPGTAPGPGSGV